MVFLREAGAAAQVAWRVSPVRRRAASDARVEGRVEEVAAADVGVRARACGGATRHGVELHRRDKRLAWRV